MKKEITIRMGREPTAPTAPTADPPWSLFDAEILLSKAWLAHFFEPAPRARRRAYELKPAVEALFAHYVSPAALAHAARQLGWHVEPLDHGDWAIRCRKKSRDPGSLGPYLGDVGEGVQKRAVRLETVRICLDTLRRGGTQ